MSNHKHLPYRRRSIRLPGYDYTQAGAYFVTLCTQRRECLFGDIVNGEMVMNDAGRLVGKCWSDIPIHFLRVELDEFVIMPNHVHGIVVITTGTGTACRAHTTIERFGRPVAGSIPTIMRSFKSAVTKRINEMRNNPGNKLWQRNYFEYVVRDDDVLLKIREYISNNPLKWEFDKENPAAMKPAPGKKPEESWMI